MLGHLLHYVATLDNFLHLPRIYIYNEFGRDTILKVEKFQIFISKFKDIR